MIFANVSDIIIPQGNVIKIHETSSGRVLWEKRKEFKPKWIEISWISFCNNRTNPTALGNRLIQFACGTDDGFGGYPADLGGKYFKAIVRSNDNSKSLLCTTGAMGFSSYFNPDNGTIVLKKVYLPGFNGSPYGIYRQGYVSNDYPGILYAMSDDGRLVYVYDENRNEYRICEANNYNRYIKTNAPMSENGVYIIHSPDRNEYLVTGISGGTFVLPDEFSSSSSINQNWQTLSKSIWVSPLNLYFAFTGNDHYVRCSDDGYSWSQFKAFNNGYVSDIAYLSKKGLLCAVHNSKAKIATSPDGQIWTEVDVPFSNALACAYSPDYDALCVLEASKAYVSSDLSNWKDIALPGNVAVSFREIIHVNYGIFIAYAYKSLNAWALVLEDE